MGTGADLYLADGTHAEFVFEGSITDALSTEWLVTRNGLVVRSSAVVAYREYDLDARQANEELQRRSMADAQPERYGGP